MRECILLLAAAAAFAAPGGARAEARLEMAPACAVAGAPDTARCGTLRVPEDRAQPEGRSLALHFVVVPGTDPAAEPILFVAGGPGQSAIEVMPLALADLRALDPRRDLVFLDQRGTGRSNPLTCPEGFDLIDLGPASAAFGRCLESLRERAALEHYGTEEAVADLEALREALGHDRVNLVAGSYGTRVALFYMREHADRVRAALLRAAAPLDFNIIAEGIAAADAELARVYDECAADRACAAAYPDLEARLAALVARLEAAPVAVTAPGGERFLVTATLFQQTLYAMMLAAPSRQLIPLVVTMAERSGFRPLALLLAQVRNQLYGALPVGMYLSVICAEDAPRLPAAGLRRGRTPLGDTGELLAAACRGWPVPAAQAGHLDQPRLATPVLIVSGALDPATTPAAAERLAASLDHGAHVVVPATAHGPLLPECVKDAAARFLAAASVEGIAPDCSGVALAPFAVPPAGAR